MSPERRNLPAIVGTAAAAAALGEELELLIFVLTDEIAGDLAVESRRRPARDARNAVAAEVAGKLGRRDGFGVSMGPLLPPGQSAAKRISLQRAPKRREIALQNPAIWGCR